MTQATESERARPAAIKAVPVRHPGRWAAIVVLMVLVAMFLHLIITNHAFNWSFIFSSYAPGKRGVMFTEPVLEGLRGTILLTILSMLIGVTLGVVIAIMRLSPNKVLSSVAWAYTWFFRAAPRLVLAVIFGNLNILWSRIGFGLPFDRQIGRLFGIDNFDGQFFSIRSVDLLAGFVAGMIALGLSEAAYMAEIVRAGIQSIDTGQSEAAVALGMSRGQVLRRVVLPQAMRVIVPPTGNEVIAMVKDTSLVAYVPVAGELFFQLTQVEARTFIVLPCLVAALIWYLIICSVLMIVQFFVERHFGKGYGAAGQARQRLRDIQVEQGGRMTVTGEGAP
ncbi:ABC transporter permease [Actinoplanes sp. SE50]|uniref:amino acid ABC transporter permease n=1 Tax=unclassified Actinoplanes TaxID=2626549 RepID=UPI00023ECFF9|nr:MULTISPECIES: amino acid ABC transporter permease [unclassified Actinoplanes]AEV82722.1 Octopine transport system permease protein occM [Actinoplanes sp. SE50/110]ATO81118.1 ABC transporter permease [Actinoplanes sp. SE50]SLL98525.1 ABC-type polar amino acid transporter, permease component [Actinoplanes sp. SE50/110]